MYVTGINTQEMEFQKNKEQNLLTSHTRPNHITQNVKKKKTSRFCDNNNNNYKE